MFLCKPKNSTFYHLIYFDKDGNRKKVSTKKEKKREAEQFLREFRPETIVKNEPEIINKSKEYDLMVFQDEYNEFIEQSKSKSYLRSVKLSFKMLLEETGNLLLEQLDKRLLEKFISKTFARSERSASLYYRTLKAAFSKAESWGYIQVNLWNKIRLPKITQSLPFFISPAEFMSIIEKVKRKDQHDIFITGFKTGMRLGEILNLTWDGVDLNERIITVKNGNGFTTKSKKERIIPMCIAVHSLLSERANSTGELTGYVFTSKVGIKYNENFISKDFKKAVRAAGLNDEIHFHTLRHSFASELIQKGVSLNVVKELLGHEDIKTTMIYSHLRKENLYQAVNLLDQNIYFLPTAKTA